MYLGSPPGKGVGAPAGLPGKSRRDARIDFLRGVALLAIFIDHVPGNFLGTLTPRNFGFSDAAELFVVLAGFSSMLAYGQQFERAGPRQALWRVFGRCLHIYAFQVGLLLLTLLIVHVWLTHFGLEPRTIGRMLNGGIRGIGHGLVLHALPSNLNILPLYILLLALFPLIYLGVRRHPGATLLVSGAVWLAANLDHDINLTNWMDGAGWFFNPFAWQFLFAIGVAAARRYRLDGNAIRRNRWLAAICWAYLAFGLVAAAPWTNWGWDFKPLDIPTDKTSLDPLRLIDIVALCYALGTAEWFTRLVSRRSLGFVAMVGRHSLEVFSAGTLLSLFGRLLFRTFQTTWQMQLLVNGFGLALMIGLAWALDSHRRPAVRLSGGLEVAAGVTMQK